MPWFRVYIVSAETNENVRVADIEADDADAALADAHALLETAEAIDQVVGIQP